MAVSSPPSRPGRELPSCCRDGDEGHTSDGKAKQKMALCAPGTRPLRGPSPGGWLGRLWGRPQNPTMSSKRRQGPCGEGDGKVPITRGVLRASQGLRSPQLGHPRPPRERPYGEIPSLLEILGPSRGCPGGGRGWGLGGHGEGTGWEAAATPGSVPGAVAWRLPGGAWGAGRCRLPELPLFAFNQDVSGGIKSTNWGNHHHKKSCACKIGQVRLQRERASDLHREEEWQQL